MVLIEYTLRGGRHVITSFYNQQKYEIYLSRFSLATLQDFLNDPRKDFYFLTAKGVPNDFSSSGTDTIHVMEKHTLPQYYDPPGSIDYRNTIITVLQKYIQNGKVTSFPNDGSIKSTQGDIHYLENDHIIIRDSAIIIEEPDFWLVGYPNIPLHALGTEKLTNNNYHVSVDYIIDMIILHKTLFPIDSKEFRSIDQTKIDLLKADQIDKLQYLKKHFGELYKFTRILLQDEHHCKTVLGDQYDKFKDTINRDAHELVLNKVFFRPHSYHHYSFLVLNKDFSPLIETYKQLNYLSDSKQKIRNILSRVEILIRQKLAEKIGLPIQQYDDELEPIITYVKPTGWFNIHAEYFHPFSNVFDYLYKYQGSIWLFRLIEMLDKNIPLPLEYYVRKGGSPPEEIVTGKYRLIDCSTDRRNPLPIFTNMRLAKVLLFRTHTLGHMEAILLKNSKFYLLSICPELEKVTVDFTKGKCVYDGENPVYLLKTNDFPFSVSLTEFNSMNETQLDSIKKDYFYNFPSIGCINKEIYTDNLYLNGTLYPNPLNYISSKVINNVLNLINPSHKPHKPYLRKYDDYDELIFLTYESSTTIQSTDYIYFICAVYTHKFINQMRKLYLYHTEGPDAVLGLLQDELHSQTSIDVDVLKNKIGFNGTLFTFDKQFVSEPKDQILLDSFDTDLQELNEFFSGVYKFNLQTNEFVIKKPSSYLHSVYLLSDKQQDELMSFKQKISNEDGLAYTFRTSSVGLIDDMTFHFHVEAYIPTDSEIGKGFYYTFRKTADLGIFSSRMIYITNKDDLKLEQLHIYRSLFLKTVFILKNYDKQQGGNDTKDLIDVKENYVVPKFIYPYTDTSKYVSSVTLPAMREFTRKRIIKMRITDQVKNYLDKLKLHYYQEYIYQYAPKKTLIITDLKRFTQERYNKGFDLVFICNRSHKEAICNQMINQVGCVDVCQPIQIKIETKYDSIIIILSHKLKAIFGKLFLYIGLANTVSAIINALSTLNIGGTLIVYYDNILARNTLSDNLIGFINRYFSDVQLKVDTNANIFGYIGDHTLICNNYNGQFKFTEQYSSLISQLYKIEFDPEDLFQYIASLKSVPKDSILYNLHQDIGYLLPESDTLKIPTSLSLPEQPNVSLLNEISSSETYNQLITQKWNLLYEDKEQFMDVLDKSLLLYLQRYIDKAGRIGFPVDKYILAQLIEITSKGIDRLLSFEIPYQQLILRDFNENPVPNIDPHKTQDYPEFEKLVNIEIVNKRLKRHIFGKYDDDETGVRAHDIARSLAKAVSKHINNNYDLDIRISNGFTKMHEILHTFNILPDKDNIKTFHMCEAPGQFIKATIRFADKRYGKKIYWRGNSLNPKVLKNVDIGDTYGMIRKFPDRWLFGKDNTGDITKVSNIEHIKEKLGRVDLITGDGGLAGDDITLLHKLDYAQCVNSLVLCSIGTNIAIKCFTPIMGHKDTVIDIYISILYLYCIHFKKLYLFKPLTSNPKSGEFYIIGKYFTGADKDVLDGLKKFLGDFKLGYSIIPRKDIPEKFIDQIYYFFNELATQSNIAIESVNIIYQCIAINDPETNKKLKCDRFLDEEKHHAIVAEKTKQWIDHFDFK